MTRISVTPAIAPAANWYWNGRAVISQMFKDLGVRFTSGADIVVKRGREMRSFDDKNVLGVAKIRWVRGETRVGKVLDTKN